MDANYGKPMFAATETLRTRRGRVGGIGPVVFPRTVEIVVLLAGVAGFVIGFLVGLIAGGSIETAGWSAVFGAAATIFLIKFQPIRHHSLYRYIRLWLASKKGRQIVHNGKRVRGAVGIAPIDSGPGGKVYIIPGAVEIDASSYDERGVRHN